MANPQQTEIAPGFNDNDVINSRKRDSDDDFSNSGEDESSSGLKRARVMDTVDSAAAQSICLMATDHPNTCSREVLVRLESNNWKVIVVNDGLDTLRLLKTRNWDLVLIDDGLSGIDCTLCAAQFRAWENENRVNRQKRFFLVSSYNIPSPTDPTAIVLAPVGFDHVIRRPIEWNDLNEFLISGNADMCIVR
jgi:CheY-like chemotaxis protein